MFSKGSSRSSAKDARLSAPSIISADAKLIGDIVSQGEVQVDGQVAGDVHCHTLVVGETGSITGECVAEVARIHGAVTGMVRARSVYLAKTSRMLGDVTHESLAIEAGAFMQGHCGRMEDGEDLHPSEKTADKADGKDRQKALPEPVTALPAPAKG